MIEGLIGCVILLGVVGVVTRAVWPELRSGRPRADLARIQALEYALDMSEDAPGTALPHERHLLGYRKRLTAHE